MAVDGEEDFVQLWLFYAAVDDEGKADRERTRFFVAVEVATGLVLEQNSIVENPSKVSNKRGHEGVMKIMEKAPGKNKSKINFTHEA